MVEHGFHWLLFSLIIHQLQLCLFVFQAGSLLFAKPHRYLFAEHGLQLVAPTLVSPHGGRVTLLVSSQDSSPLSPCQHHWPFGTTSWDSLSGRKVHLGHLPDGQKRHAPGSFANNKWNWEDKTKTGNPSCKLQLGRPNNTGDSSGKPQLGGPSQTGDSSGKLQLGRRSKTANSFGKPVY